MEKCIVNSSHTCPPTPRALWPFGQMRTHTQEELEVQRVIVCSGGSSGLVESRGSLSDTLCNSSLAFSSAYQHCFTFCLSVTRITSGNYFLGFSVAGFLLLPQLPSLPSPPSPCSWRQLPVLLSPRGANAFILINGEAAA